MRPRPKRAPSAVRTWIEIDRRAAAHNYRAFRSLIGPKVRLWAVVKSNAYGHGIFLFAKLMDKLGVDGFCVDSLIEGVKLRAEGIRKPVLVLGPTLPVSFPQAAREKLRITVSNFDGLRALLKQKKKPEFYLKLDTGMHRQGFLMKDDARVIAVLRKAATPAFRGLYTHFAAAADPRSASAKEQFEEFMARARNFEEAGFRGLELHAAATGGALIDPRYHLSAVRVGKGLYGFFPSRELEAAHKFKLRPVLTWKTYVAELKDLLPGDAVGYDLTETVTRPTRMAVLPIGYWQGLPRALSSKGEVLVRGARAKILGRVSMDLTVIDVTGIPCKVGDPVTVIGKDKGAEMNAWELAGKAGTIHYELLTRLNPLIEKRIV
jgi:alanine racemase